MSGLFGSPSTNSMQQEVYTGIQVTTSLLGGSIPYVAGRTRVGMNLIWYGNFTVNTANSGGGKGGGGGGTKQYSYGAAFIAGLCIGPIQGINRIWHDRALLDGGQSANLTYENLTLALGSSGQAVWGGFPAGTPAAQQIPYDHIAYVASSAYNFGSSAAMPNLTFEVEGVVGGYADGSAIYDADPSAVIPDYLLDPVHGALANYPGTPLTVGSPDAPLTGTSNSYQAYVQSLGLLTSPYEDTQRQSTDFLQEILDCTNSNCWLSCDTLKVIPYCDQAVSATVAGTPFSYTPNLTPLYVFTDDDFCPADGEPPVKLNRAPQSDSFNMLNVEYKDRSDYYNTQSVQSSDLSDIAKYGPRLAPSKSWHQVTQAQVARTAGQLWLQRQLYERNTYTFRVRRNYALLEGMDFVSLTTTDPNMQLTGQLCQVTEVETEDDDKGGHLVVTAREIPGVTRTTAQYNWSGAQGYFANYLADPGAVQAPMIFQMPSVPALLTPGGIGLGIAVCGQTANAAWLGCDVYCSVDGGSTYQYIGTVPEACRYGTITANLLAQIDPDSISTLSVALANTNLQLSTAVTHAEADGMQTLVLVDTGTNAEVIAYGAAALVSAGNYNLTYLRRGLYSSNDNTHSSGVAFARLDGAIFQFALDAGYAGQTVKFKFVSFNTFTRYGNQTLAGATAYSYVVPSAATGDTQISLLPRGSCAISAQNVYKATTAAAAWDSDCVSSAFLSGGCQIIGRFANGGSGCAIGLVTNVPTLPTTLQPGVNMDYCIDQHVASGHVGGSYLIYEGGTLAQTLLATPAIGDVLQIVYDNFWVRYYLNSSLQRSVPAPGLTLYGAVAMFDPGDVLSGVEFTSLAAATPAQFIASGSAVVNDEHIGKPTGSAAWDSAATSLIGYPTCHIAGKPNTVNTSAPLGRTMMGLCTSTHMSQIINGGAGLTALYYGLDYAWYADENAWAIFESGTAISTVSTTAAITDRAWITYDGANIKYYLNDPTTAVRTVAVAGLTLFGAVMPFDVSAVAGMNSVDFGPTTTLGLIDSSGVGFNAATDLFTTTTATTTLTAGTAANVCSLTIGPYPWATEVVLTGSGDWNITTGAGGIVGSTAEIFADISSIPPATSQTYRLLYQNPAALPASTTVAGAFANEATFSLAAGVTQTYYMNAHLEPAGFGLSGSITQAVLKAEVIKR